MCNRAVESNPIMIKYIPNEFKSQDMCNKAVKYGSWLLQFIPDRFKMQDMFNNAVEYDPWFIFLVSDWFVTLRYWISANLMIECENLYDEYCHREVTKGWYDGYPH